MFSRSQRKNRNLDQPKGMNPFEMNAEKPILSNSIDKNDEQDKNYHSDEMGSFYSDAHYSKKTDLLDPQNIPIGKIDDLEIPNTPPKIYKNGANLMEEVPAYTIHKPDAIYVDTENTDGYVKKMPNGDLILTGGNVRISHKPAEQILQPNSHIASLQKNKEADMRLASIHQQQQKVYTQPSNQTGLNNNTLSLVALSVAGSSLAQIMIGSYAPYMMLGLGGSAVWLLNNNGKNENSDNDSEFSKRLKGLNA